MRHKPSDHDGVGALLGAVRDPTMRAAVRKALDAGHIAYDPESGSIRIDWAALAGATVEEGLRVLIGGPRGPPGPRATLFPPTPDSARPAWDGPWIGPDGQIRWGASPPPKAGMSLEEAYKALGCTASSTDEQLAEARKARIRKYHPDQFQSGTRKHALAGQRMARLNVAWDAVQRARRGPVR